MRRKSAIGLVSFLISALFITIAYAESAYCSRVVDGDTIIVEYNGKSEKVRLIGVDTPETVHPNKPVEFFGEEASKFTKSLVQDKSVKLEFDWQKRDKYGRLLAYVFLPDGTFVNKKIIEDGYGHAYTRYPFKYMDDFKYAERLAREKQKGLWGATNQSVGEINTKEIIETNIATNDSPNVTVYVTKTGRKYHRDGCRHLRKSKIPMTLKEAVDAGYTPCKVCRPPTLQ